MTESGQYVAGRRVGIWVFHIEPTDSESTEYRDGRKNGRYLSTESGRKVDEGWYENGLQSGTWRTWNPSGTLVWQEEYREGAPLSQNPQCAFPSKEMTPRSVRGAPARRALEKAMVSIMIGIMQVKRAKLFQTGRSQAVRLPKEFRFKGESVLVRRDGAAVVLEPDGWPEGYLRSFAGVGADFARPAQGKLDRRQKLR